MLAGLACGPAVATVTDAVVAAWPVNRVPQAMCQEFLVDRFTRGPRKHGRPCRAVACG